MTDEIKQLQDYTIEELETAIAALADGDFRTLKSSQGRQDKATMEILHNKRFEEDPEYDSYIRRIQQKELTSSVGYVLSGETTRNAFIKTAIEHNINLDELLEASRNYHKKTYLNNMYRKAFTVHEKPWKELIDSGFVTQSDILGYEKVTQGLKRIEKGVEHKRTHEILQKEIDELKIRLSTYIATHDKELQKSNIKQLQENTSLTLQEKITILLKDGYNNKQIRECLGCTRRQVDYVISKLEK